MFLWQNPQLLNELGSSSFILCEEQQHNTLTDTVLPPGGDQAQH